jgi:hypothetical protein
MDTAARPNQRMQRDQIPPLQVLFDWEFSCGGIGRLILNGMWMAQGLRVDVF